MIECMICHLFFRSITNSHLKRKHGISSEKYKIMFPHCEMTSEETRKKITGFKGHNFGLCKKCGKYHVHGNSSWAKGHNFKGICKKCGKKHYNDDNFFELHSEKMKINNPMYNEESVKKMVNTQRLLGYYDIYPEKLVKSQKEQPSITMLKEKNLEKYNEICKNNSERMKSQNPMHNKESIQKKNKTIQQKIKADPNYLKGKKYKPELKKFQREVLPVLGGKASLQARHNKTEIGFFRSVQEYNVAKALILNDITYKQEKIFKYPNGYKRHFSMVDFLVENIIIQCTTNASPEKLENMKYESLLLKKYYPKYTLIAMLDERCNYFDLAEYEYIIFSIDELIKILKENKNEMEKNRLNKKIQ